MPREEPLTPDPHHPDPSETGDLSELLLGGLAAGFGPESQRLPADDPPEQSSVIEHLKRSAGLRPRVALQSDDPKEAVVGDGDEESQSQTGKYQIHGELARGGIGVVFRGHDVDLGRDVAVKVLQQKHRSDLSLLQRFVEEAQIGGQLQHPGIVPVYDLGMRDGSPFFTMKLIKGRTLAELLHERGDTSEERRRFLTIFEQICQTMAYAHTRGVIHRDLKPANIMVGAFGEVQVVDWGMGKVLTLDESQDDAQPRSRNRDDGDEEVSTVRSKLGPESSGSITGSVMGTLAYMPPEQANGDVESMDERSDVFALGAILCEVLTGKAPYVGKREDLFAMAAAAQLAPCKERLAASGADTALVEIVDQCLEPTAASRPRNATVVADRVAAYLASVEERARQAQIEVAEERVRATAARRSQKLAFGLAIACGVIAVGLVLGLVLVSNEKERTAQQAERAEKNFALAVDAVDKMLTHVPEQLENVPLMQTVRRDMLREALTFQQKFLEMRRDDDAFREEVAHAYMRTSLILFELGENDEAESMARASLVQFEQLAKDRPGDETPVFESIRVRMHLAITLVAGGDDTGAARIENDTVALVDDLVRKSPDEPLYLESKGTLINNRATRVFGAGDSEGALALMLEAIAVQERVVAMCPDQPDQLFHLAMSRRNLGNALIRLRREGEAEESIQRAIGDFDTLLEISPLSRRFRLAHAKAHGVLGISQKSRSLDVAAGSMRTAIERLRKLADEFPNVTAHNEWLGATQCNLCGVLLSLKQPKLALEAVQSGLAAIVKARRALPDLRRLRRYETNLRSRLCKSLMANGRIVDAIKQADTLAALPFGSGPLVSAAEVFARCGEFAKDPALQRKHNTRCLRLLEQAVDKGLRSDFELGHPWFKHLRDSERFRKLVARMHALRDPKKRP